jgi:creatinine amidohydrolase
VALGAAEVFVARMTSEELDAVLRGALRVAVLLPVGAIEPHGPHLPLDTDVIISRSAAARAVPLLRAQGVHALVAPEVAYGVTECASGFAGAASVPAPALAGYLCAVVAGWLSNGAAHVGVVSNHLEPAHDETVRAVAASFAAGRASVATPLSRRWARTLSEEFKRGACHAGEYETSIVLAVDAASVRSEIASRLPPVDISLSEKLRAGVATFRGMGLERAYAGSPARASAVHGDEMLDRLAAMVAGEVMDAMGIPPAKRSGGGEP